MLGKDHPETLATRNNIANWTREIGHVREALRLLQELLPDQEWVLGKDHPDVLTTRHNIAIGTVQTGDAAKALRLFRDLLPDKSACSARTTRTREPPAHGYTAPGGKQGCLIV